MSNINKSVGRLDFLGSDGKVGESVEYSDAKLLQEAIRHESEHGAPFVVVLYADENGNTIPHNFLRDMEPTFRLRFEDPRTGKPVDLMPDKKTNDQPDRIMRGDYVLSAHKNAFNSKTSWWISKRGCTEARYCFTSDSQKETVYQLGNFDSYIKMFEDALQKERKVPQSAWVPVAERLPSKSGTYIVHCDDSAEPYDERIWGDSVVIEADYYPGGWCWNENGTEYDLDGIVTHWMPRFLPEAPEG